MTRISEARLDRLEVCVRTLLVWMASSANSPLRREEIERLLAIIAEESK